MCLLATMLDVVVCGGSGLGDERWEADVMDSRGCRLFEVPFQTQTSLVNPLDCIFQWWVVLAVAFVSSLE